MRPLLPVAAAFLALVLLAPPVGAQATEPVEVGVGLYVLSIGNYDVAKGTYTTDFYLILKWNSTQAPVGFTPERFEFMNGRATAKERIFNDTSSNREVWYRIQAQLYAEPQFSDYPYDKQTLSILMEDTTRPRSELVYVPLQAESGLDSDARVPGWKSENVSFVEETKAYKFGEEYSRLHFSVRVYREGLSSSIKSFLPPAAFIIVAALGFFFHPSKTLNRITLGTGMLVAAVAFHISQTSSLPPLGTLIFFDRVMISVYAFIAVTLAVGVLIAIDEDYWKDRDYTRAINVWGGVAAVVIPVATYLLLDLL